jgi:hypothetical protein
VLTGICLVFGPVAGRRPAKLLLLYGCGDFFSICEESEADGTADEAAGHSGTGKRALGSDTRLTGAFRIALKAAVACIGAGDANHQLLRGAKPAGRVWGAVKFRPSFAKGGSRAD